jgi:hypothetical protein
VLIGEASHGTSEFYQWRALLTRRLIAERGSVTGPTVSCSPGSEATTGASSQQSSGAHQRGS